MAGSPLDAYPALGPVAALLSSCTWAIGSTTYSKLARDHRPFDINYSRAILAVPFFILVIVLMNSGLTGAYDAIRNVSAANVTWLSISVVASYAVGDLFFLWSSIALGPPSALAIASSYPILITLIGVFFDDQQLRAVQWTGLFLSISGVALVILNAPKQLAPLKTEQQEIQAHPFLKKKSIGVACALLTTCFWAMNGYSVAKGGAGVDPFMGSFIRMIAAILFIAIISLVVTRKRPRLLPRPELKKYGWVFVLESFLGSCFFLYGLSRSSLVLGSTLTALAPVLAVPVSIALKLERFSWVRTFALLLVIAGLSLLFR